MASQYNQYNLEASFRSFLVAGNTLPVSLKNYLSDIRHFLGWLTLQEIKEEASSQGLIAALTVNSMQRYQIYLAANNIPIKTINRRLSTLRKFCAFCVSEQWIAENPMETITNMKVAIKSPIVSEYENYLTTLGLSNSEISEEITNVSNLLKVSSS